MAHHRQLINHEPERMFVSGRDCIVIPLHFRPHTVDIDFIDADPVRHPGCHPVHKDKVEARLIIFPPHKLRFAIQICWSVSGTREIEWRVTELSS